MFEKLKKKWKVTNLDLVLILCVFAVTGTTTAYISRYITDWLGLSAESPLWKRAALRGGMLIFGYQIIILIVSVPFGQFKFFWNYEKKILRRMGILKKEEKTED
jgi:hypothetical protein